MLSIGSGNRSISMFTNLESTLFHRMPFGDVVAPSSPEFEKPTSTLRTNRCQRKMFHSAKRKDCDEEQEIFRETTKSKAEVQDWSCYRSRNSSSSCLLTVDCCSDLVMDIDNFNLPGPCRYECGTSTKFVSRTVQYKAVQKTQGRKRSRAKNQGNGYSDTVTTDSLFRRLDAHVMSTTPDLSGSEVRRNASENDSTTAESLALKLKQFEDIELISLPGPFRYECGTATKFISRNSVSKERDCNEINSKTLYSGHPTPLTPSSGHEPASIARKLSHEFQIMSPQHDVAQLEDSALLRIITPGVFYRKSVAMLTLFAFSMFLINHITTEALSRLHMEHDSLKLQPKNKKRRHGHRCK